MRIEGSGFFKLFGFSEKASTQVKAPNPNINDEVTKKDIYKFNYEAKEMKEYQNKALNTQTVRESKVEDLKQQLENGSYFVSGNDVLLKVLGDK